MLFSVIVPIYNVEKFLPQCVESVLRQTFPDFELILVNDGTEDNCGQLIDGYAAADVRIVPVHKTNGGLVSARKAGLAAARGEYVVVLDGDDWLAESALSCMAAAIQRHHPDLVCCGYFAASEEDCTGVAITSQNRVYDRKAIEETLLPNLLPGRNANGITPNLWGKAFRRGLYEKYQKVVDNRIAMGEDGVVVYPSVCEANTICFLRECLYYYRVNPASLTRSRGKLIPWESALLRIDHLKAHLPLNHYRMQQQLGCYAAHAVFNVIFTQLHHKPYAQVRKEARQHLSSGELMQMIRDAQFVGSFPEKLAQFALRNRWIWLIKLYAMIR